MITREDCIRYAVTGPVLAVAANSPVLFERRLWHETRVALFQQSIDARSRSHQARGLPPRVSFGDHWIESSVLEIFREDVARFRIVLETEADEVFRSGVETCEKASAIIGETDELLEMGFRGREATRTLLLELAEMLA